MLPLQLDRPLAVIDLETTGLNPRVDRIVEMAILKLMPDGRREDHVFRINPGMPIPPVVTAIHGITDADVAGKPSFADLAPKIWELLDGCDLAGFGIVRYDVLMLREEFARCAMTFQEAGRRLLDAQRIYHKKEPRDLTAALAFYCNEQHVDAHGAKADCEAALKVLAAQLRKYGDLPQDLDALDDYCSMRQPDWADQTGKLRWVNGEIVINFGKQCLGQKLRELARENQKFLHWLLKSDFPCDTKQIVGDALEGKYPAPPAVPAVSSGPD